MLRGSGQPAPPACRSRLRSAGCAVCPSRRSHTPAALSAPRGAAHTQPPLWAWPAGGSTCAGRVGSSRRRALRYGGRAATFFFTFAGGCGVWDPFASLTEGTAGATQGTQTPHANARPRRGRERVAHRQRCPRARERAGLRPERPHAPQERPEAPDGASGLAQPEA